MNIHKHMEAIFVVTLAVVGTGAFALDSVTLADASPAAPVLRAAAAPAAGAGRRRVRVQGRAPRVSLLRQDDRHENLERRRPGAQRLRRPPDHGRRARRLESGRTRLPVPGAHHGQPVGSHDGRARDDRIVRR